jgi:hypothetical protein
MTLSHTLLAGGLLLIVPALHAQEQLSDWEAVFPIAAAPARVYFRAHYVDGNGTSHKLQVWRDGDQRLRRETDDLMDFYVDRDAAGNFDYHIIDHARRILIHADRLTLYRLGRFPDWRGLAHMLDIPHAPYQLTILPRAAQSTLFGECKWIRLQAAESPSLDDICWSQAWGIPLTIEDDRDGERMTQFSIDDVHVLQANDENVFTIDNKGLIEIDGRATNDPFH